MRQEVLRAEQPVAAFRKRATRNISRRSRGSWPGSRPPPARANWRRRGRRSANWRASRRGPGVARAGGGAIRASAGSGSGRRAPRVRASVRDAGRKPDYDATVRQGVDLLAERRRRGALKLARQLMQSDPDRWEAYSMAGSVAKIEKPAFAGQIHVREGALAGARRVKASLRQALQEDLAGRPVSAWLPDRTSWNVRASFAIGSTETRRPPPSPPAGGLAR